jgi:hypothetical protein
MATEVGEPHGLTEPIIRREHLSARNYAGMCTETDIGECGHLVDIGPQHGASHGHGVAE